MNEYSAETDGSLDRAITGVLNLPIPEFPNPQVRFPEAAIETATVRPQTDLSASDVSRRRLIAFGTLSLATTLVLAAVLFSAWPKDSWAQVVQAVRKQQWVRLRASAPAEAAKDKQSDVDIWFSPDKQIIAGRVPGSTLFVELKQQRQQRYDQDAKIIYVSDSSSYDEEAFASFCGMVEAFNSGNQVRQPGTIPEKLLSQTRQEGREGSRSWTDFIFTYEDPRRTPSQYRRIFHVPSEAKLPTNMVEEWLYDGKTMSRVMQMDYPEFGPADLAALGVPGDAKIVDTHTNPDLKSVLKSYAEQQRTGQERYSAVVLRTVVEKPDWKWVNEMYKVQFDGAAYTTDSTDIEQLLELDMSIHEKKLAIPDSMAERLAWWKAESTKLKSTLYQGATEIQTFAPDRVGYPQLGTTNEQVQATIESHPALGPAETVMVTFVETKTGKIKSRYWLAPNRGYLCVRTEWHPASGYLPDNNDWISTTIIDVAEKSPQGHWFATQIRQGIVKRSGDDLSAGAIAGAPYGTTTWRILLDFENN